MKGLKKGLAGVLSIILSVSGMSFPARADVEDFEYEIVDDGACITFYDGEDEEVIIPDELDGYPVVAIGTEAFYACMDVTSIQLPATVTEIGPHAFATCWCLTEINLPAGLTSIGEGAFMYCLDLEELDIPSGITELPVRMFSMCDQLRNVTIPDTVTSIGEKAFYHCASLEEITIPDSVKEIDTDAFSDCNSLRSVEIPPTVETIADYAFGYKLDPAGNHSAIVLEIIGAKGSAAEAYAEANGFYFIEKDYGTGEDEKEFPFTDVKESAWYYEFVKEVYERGLMTGFDSTTFAPKETMTRAMVATVLYRMAGSPETTYEKLFPDVPAGKYYSFATTWAVQNGVVSGYGDGKFKPGTNVTREQLATMLYNYANMLGMDTSDRADLTVYKDGTQISGYAKNPMRWAVANGILSGTATGELKAKSDATRAEVAKMLLNFYKLLENE